jgi:hypothetical protein
LLERDTVGGLSKAMNLAEPLPPFLFHPGVGPGGGDAAGGGFTDVTELSDDYSMQVSRASGSEALGDESLPIHHSQDRHVGLSHISSEDKKSRHLLEQTLEEVERLRARVAHADEEKRRCLEASRNFKGMVRIMGRVRPALQGEEDDVGCLRVLSKQQLEVLTEPRAQLTEQHVRNRRRTTGGIRDSLGSKSAQTLSEAEINNTPEQVPLEPRIFTFDDVFGSDASDDDIFASVHEDLAAAVDGEAVCILAYGATGSGKTHTVQNLAERTAQELERQAAALAACCMRLEITVQIVEIYNEQLRDLLAPDGSALKLKLSVSPSTADLRLQGATLRTISMKTGDGALGGGIARSLRDYLRAGQAQRATSETAVHGRSSRSHLVMTLFLTQYDESSGSLHRAGKLSLVDLAGSERLKRSEAVGDRLREAQNINRSLSALADVISAKERRVAFVPYRNSKLTHLLQDALGGQQQCRTVVIVALPPTRYNMSDTLHSLQFSSRLTALSLPMVVSRRSLTTFDQGRMQRLRSAHDLSVETERLREENAKLNETLSGYMSQMVEKDRQLEEARREALELRSSTEYFEKSREKLFSGFEVLHRCLEDVEATTLGDLSSLTGPTGSLACNAFSESESSMPPMEMSAEISTTNLSRNPSSSAGALHEVPSSISKKSRLGSPPPRATNRSGSGILQVKRTAPNVMHPVLRVSRPVGVDAVPAVPPLPTYSRSPTPPSQSPQFIMPSARVPSSTASSTVPSARRKGEASLVDERRSASPPLMGRGRVNADRKNKAVSPAARISRNASPEMPHRRLRPGVEGAASAGGLPKAAATAQNSRNPSPEVPSRRNRGGPVVGHAQGNDSSASRLPKAFPVAGQGSPEVPARRQSPELPPRSRPRSKDPPREVPTPARNRQPMHYGTTETQVGGERSTASGSHRIPLVPAA